MGQKKVNQIRAVASVFVTGAAYCAYLAITTYSWLSTFYSSVGCVFCLFLVLIAWDISRLNPANSHTIVTILLQYGISRVFYLLGWKVVWDLHLASLDLDDSQSKLLMDIVRKNKDTAYGKVHNFGKITTVREYKTNVPLTEYRDYQEYIGRIEQGEDRVLTEDQVVYLAQSSGTTGKNKVIPITHNMKGPAARKFGPLMYHFMEKKVGLNLQRTFVLSYKATLTKSVCGLEKGPVSAHMSRYIPFVVSPRECYDVTNEQAALHIHAVFALQEPEVGHAEALMSTIMYSFWKYVEHHHPSICDDIEQGTLSSKISADLHILSILNAQLSPNPKRALELRQIFQNGMNGVAKRIWPNMRFSRMLTTGSFAVHAKYLKEHHMSGVLQVSQAHAASEGFMGFNLSSDPNDYTYTAMINYAFMEFIPVQFMQDDRPRVFSAGELRHNWSYEVIITTPMGLYRYRTGDVIKVIGHYYETPIYTFEYRIGQILNLYWEKTDEKIFYEAIMKTVDTFDDVTLCDFTATENVNCEDFDEYDEEWDSKHYCLFIELDKNGKEYGLSESEKCRFDDTLRGVLEMYRMFRENGSIAAMRVIEVKAGSFQSLKSKIIAATQNQQYKLPRVTRNKDNLQFLLSRQI